MVEAASLQVDMRENEPSCESQLSSKVTSESYPIAQPLATILQKAVQIETNDGVSVINANYKSSKNVELVLEPIEDALQNIIRNCFVAMDEMFFYT